MSDVDCDATLSRLSVQRSFTDCNPIDAYSSRRTCTENQNLSSAHPVKISHLTPTSPRLLVLICCCAAPCGAEACAAER